MTLKIRLCLKLCLLGWIVIWGITDSVYSQANSASEWKVVSEEDKSPISNVSIEVRTLTGDDPAFLYRTQTSAGGQFTLNNVGEYPVELVFVHPNYMRNSVVLDSLPKQQFEVEMAYAHSIQIGGRVDDGITGNSVPSALIEIVSENENVDPVQNIGTTTNRDGEFRFSFNYSVPFKIRVTHVSYFPATREIDRLNASDLSIKISSRVFQEDDIIITADMVTTEELRSTNTIGRVSSVDVQQLSSFDAFDLISTIREVDVATQSMNMQTVSTRGFSTGASSRVLQLTDGIDNQAPGLGFPIGNLLGPIDLDIAAMEMMLGPSSSTYGPSAMSGVLNINSRNPFDSPGFSFQTKGGVNDLKLGGASQFAAEGDGMLDVMARYAQVIQERFAFKITGSWLTGSDWRANNYKNIGTGESWQTHQDVHGYNGVNIYGDDARTFLPLGFDQDGVLNGSLVPVTRTGYKEGHLVDYDIETRKMAGSLYYRPTSNAELMVGGRYGYTNTLYTDDSRIRLEDFEIFQLATEFKSDKLFVRGYKTWQNSGNSYDVIYMANQLLNSAKSDEDWFRDYRIAFENGVPIRGIPGGDLMAARNFANSGITLIHDSEAQPYLEPGTDEFNSEFNRLQSVYDFEDGAGIKDNSTLTHAEAGYVSDDRIEFATITAGGSFRFYDLESAGTIFPDTTGNNITNYRYGAYVRAEANFLDDDLTLNTALRFDKNENFKPAISPQAGLNYLLAEKHFIRTSYQFGFRFPTVREQFMNQNIGNGRILGGIAENTEQYRLQLNSVTEQALNRFNRAVIDEINDRSRTPGESINRDQAELLHLDILSGGIVGESSLTGIQPEKTHAFELGYRRLFSSNLYLDLNYYVSFYNDFIGLTRVLKPRTSPTTDLFAASGQLNNSTQSDRYFVYSNAKDRVTVHGLSFDLKQQSGTYFFGLNGTITELIKGADDPLIPGFNTPPLKLNLEWGNRKIAENVGFKMVFRHRTSHTWRSPFLDGELKEYGHFDFQVNVGIPEIDSMVKLGLTNLGIKKYSNMFGGPAIGSIVFATFTYNPGMF